MRLISVHGKPFTKNVTSRLINWEGKSRSKFQEEVKALLKERWSKHVVFEEFPVFGSKMTLDFFNFSKMIAVEVQGAQHTSYVKGYFHRGRQDYLSQIKKDLAKFNFCENNSIKLFEIFESERKKLSIEFLIEKGLFEV